MLFSLWLFMVGYPEKTLEQQTFEQLLLPSFFIGLISLE